MLQEISIMPSCVGMPWLTALAIISLITMSASSMTAEEARWTVRNAASFVRATLGVDRTNGRRTTSCAFIVTTDPTRTGDAHRAHAGNSHAYGPK